MLSGAESRGRDSHMKFYGSDSLLAYERELRATTDFNLLAVDISLGLHEKN